jgi:5-methyltetrahydropteroyltriglutamate--homocysteine methyltransferase
LRGRRGSRTTKNTSCIEPVEALVARAEAAVDLFGAERVLLNPDCGFATFADNPISSARLAEQQLAAIVQAARLVRQRHGVEC